MTELKNPEVYVITISFRSDESIIDGIAVIIQHVIAVRILKRIDAFGGERLERRILTVAIVVLITNVFGDARFFVDAVGVVELDDVADLVVTMIPLAA